MPGRPPIASSAALNVGILADTVDHPGGIGRYVREVLAACDRRDDVDVVVATPQHSAATVRSLMTHRLAAIVTAPVSDQVSLALWDRHRAGAAFAGAGVDVVIGCKHLVPRTTVPTVLVVHDLLTITRARENAPVKRVLLPRQYRQSLTSATHLVAVSAATRDRLATLDPGWATKCDVVPNGMSRTLMTVDPAAPDALAGREFALVVGDLSPRKNLRLLTELWATEPPTGLMLAVVGPEAGGDREARAALVALERAGRVVWIRGATDPTLRWCYEHARVVLFPTLEEGFGLPLLEAMSFHAPVVASTDAALVEVAAGDASVVHVAPTDRAAWRAAIAAAVARPRVALPPTVPPGALTWDEHTERLLAIARHTAGREAT